MGYYGKSEDHLERKFSPRQFVPEDAAVVLGAIGKPAVEPLATLLDHADPWMRINAAYALGEAGPDAAGMPTPISIGELLDDPVYSVAPHRHGRPVYPALLRIADRGPSTSPTVR